MQFLRANGFGGILADEMGPGKTLQVLAHLSALKTGRGSRVPAKGVGGADAASTVEPNFSAGGTGQEVCPALVVCPTLLVFNWAAEVAKFTPDLRVLTLQGLRRFERFAQIPQHDIVITSYALLRRDAEQYRGLEFDTVVLDEAQHIKNRQTQNVQAVKQIRCQHRLVLTGTPMENSVLDLWSIFDFMMPGYLGAAQEFRERYELPIVRERSVEAQNRLTRRLRPFMLRRLKRDVAADLPEKIEQVSYCDLNEDQRALYQQVLQASRREILNTIDANGLAKSRMLVLTALLRLRQICCDLRLLDLGQSSSLTGAEAKGLSVGEPPNSVDQSLEGADTQAAGSSLPAVSGKVEMFGELLEDVIGGEDQLVDSLNWEEIRDLLTGLGRWPARRRCIFREVSHRTGGSALIQMNPSALLERR